MSLENGTRCFPESISNRAIRLHRKCDLRIPKRLRRCTPHGSMHYRTLAILSLCPSRGLGDLLLVAPASPSRTPLFCLNIPPPRSKPLDCPTPGFCQFPWRACGEMSKRGTGAFPWPMPPGGGPGPNPWAKRSGPGPGPTHPLLPAGPRSEKFGPGRPLLRACIDGCG